MLQSDFHSTAQFPWSFQRTIWHGLITPKTAFWHLKGGEVCVLWKVEGSWETDKFVSLFFLAGTAWRLTHRFRVTLGLLLLKSRGIVSTEWGKGLPEYENHIRFKNFFIIIIILNKGSGRSHWETVWAAEQKGHEKGGCVLPGVVACLF